jgi:hypothetical protein
MADSGESSTDESRIGTTNGVAEGEPPLDRAQVGDPPTTDLEAALAERASNSDG